ncbi:Glycosyltransferase Gtf1 [Lactobacillus helveticus]|uniref:glycosyltransferase n=1 Tax=Lactobacillus helveticus TaxID=1587 RepID=UPI0019F9BEC4|nr:glycosyltransferase [Lactobacillus helveticus]NRO31112.1 Glycosyltransferase Gtf1 [Lactobacillus helveticus]
MGVSQDKISVIYNPIPAPKNIIQRTGKQNHFIYIGRIDYDGQKNVSELMRALDKVSNSFTCDLYGSVDTNTKDKLLDLISNNKKIVDNIKFHGFFEDIWDQIQKADVLILTSKYEGFPMVLCESIAHGISVVAANCPTGVNDIVNKNNGYLYTPGNLIQLEKISNAIVNKSIVLPSVKSVNKTINKFNYKNYVKRIIDDFDNDIK